MLAFEWLKNRFQTAVKSRFVRDVAVVATGTGAAQAITMAFAPVITRLYGPEAFGQWGIFMAVLAIFTPIAALTYPIAIVLPREDSEARSLARLSLLTSLGVAVLLALIIGAFGESFLGYFGAQAIAPLGLLLPVVLFFEGGVQVGQQWLIRKQFFAVGAKIAVAQAIINNGTKTGIGLLKPYGTTLIAITTVARVFHASILWVGGRQARKGREDEAAEKMAPFLPYKLAGKYYDFPLYRAPRALIYAVSQNLPVLMLANFSGAAAAGFYTIGRTFLGLPSQLIAKSVADVFYPRISHSAHKGENLHGLTIRATVGLAAIGFVPFLVVFLFGPWLFGLVFGSEWVKGGIYARWLSLFFFFNFIDRPAVAAVPVLGVQRGFLIYEVISTACKFCAILIGFQFFSSDIVAVALFSLTGTLAYTVLIFWVFGALKKWDGAQLDLA